jgi:hypothetical protein
MRQVYLNILHLYFSIYFVVLDLHDRKVYQCYGYLIILVWRIGFGVTGLELCSVNFDSSGLCLVDSESLW